MENNEFASIKIGLASPEMIRNWSYGEVTKPETVNYRTLKPEPGGLFCERVFGPTKDGACSCGNYKKAHTNGEKIVCPKCGVEVTTKKVRRERMGHIELASPVSHIWYFKGTPSKLATILEIKVKDLEQVLYYAQNVVVKAPENSELFPGRVLTEKECADFIEAYGSDLKVGMGAEAIRELLRGLGLEREDVEKREALEAIPADERTEEQKAEIEALSKKGIDNLAKSLREALVTATAANKAKIIKRLEVVENFRKSGNHVEWMILDVIPVLPPDLRPMVQLDGGRFASSDLNELYRRVINRNNRLNKLIELKTPEIVIRNEKRMLQEAVDALIDNGKHGKPVTGPNNRTLKSLSEMLRGKQGRFRQNLLGKRVDYSGRSVIVVGPSLKIYQCGLPKEMALELFKPFVVKRLVEMNCATSVKDAQRKIDRAQNSNDEVWDALEIVIKEHPVLLNRAPTLHRLSIQAFEPVLVEGRAIKLHPLVCTAFNADFDGDQMPVHVPLSAEAQAEARFLMLSANNLLKPVDGRAVTVPTQDMILGSYYLTIVRTDEPGCGNTYRDFDEAMMAYSSGCLGLHAPIAVIKSNDLGEHGLIGIGKNENGERCVNTGKDAVTLGRLIFNNNIPQDLGFVDRSDPAKKFDLEIAQLVTKKELGQIINSCIKRHSSADTAKMLDAIKETGYKFSTRASFSISVYDMTIPKEKKELISGAEAKVAKLQKDFNRGKLAEQERYDSVIKVWNKTTDDVTKALQAGFSTYNPIKIMADSGARGSMTQMRQLAGMRGPMFATNGKTMEIPIKSNFREGMKIFEYFMGARSSRKSLSDTALKTADSGYLTRRLVDVSQDIIVREEKCNTKHGAWVTAIFENDKEFTTFSPAAGGKLADSYAYEDVIDPATGAVLAQAKAKITAKAAEKIIAAYAGSDAEIKIYPKALEGLEDRIIGRYTIGEIVDPETGVVIAGDDEMLDEKQAKAVIAAGIASVQIRTVIQCHARHGICAHCYGADLANGKLVNLGEAVGIIAAQSIGEPGTQLTMRTFHSGGVAGSDITQGLPRVEELFEARAPKKPAVLSDFHGFVSIETVQTDAGPLDYVTVSSDELGESKKYQIPFGRRLVVADGQEISVGEAITDGSKVLADIMRLNGPDSVYDYIITEVQKTYRAQSVNVNDKHIEVIARQMTRKLRVTDPGDTELLEDSVISVNEFEDVNAEIYRRNEAGEVNSVGEPLKIASANPMLMGITKAALATDSFMSAASFQETTKVLTDAAIKGKIDNLLGLKENVIIGKLIPAGTGMSCYRNVTVEPTAEPSEEAGE